MCTEPDPGVDCEEWYDMGIMSADWKGSPGSVLDGVDAALKGHGLEVVMIDTQDDSYTFKIAPKLNSTIKE